MKFWKEILLYFLAIIFMTIVLWFALDHHHDFEKRRGLENPLKSTLKCSLK